MKKRIFTLLTCTIAGGLSLVGNAEAMTYKVNGTSTRIAIPSNITGTTIKRCNNCDEVILDENNPDCEIIDDKEFNKEALVCTHTYNNNGTYTIVYDGKFEQFENFSLSNGNVSSITDFSSFLTVDNLYLNNNKLTNLDSLLIDFKPINIQLENNQLTGIDNFHYITYRTDSSRNLEKLNLSGNKFTSIPYEIFCSVFDGGHCNNYYYLILDGNILGGGGTDGTIDLSNNPIKWIRIEQADVTQNSCHFGRFGYSGGTSNFEYYYKLIDNPTGNIKKDGNTSNTEVTINSIGIGSYTFTVCIGNKLSKDCSDYLFSIDPPTYKLTIKYIYADGGDTAADTYTEDNLTEGTERSLNSPTISGYTADMPVVNWTMQKSDKTIIVRYTKNPEPTQTYTLTINYKYSDGSTASATVTKTLTGGASYSVSSPIISNYTASTSVVKGTMPNSDKTIDVVYKKIQTTGGGGGGSSSSSSSNSTLEISVSPSSPDIYEGIKVTIETDDDYTDKVYFSKLQYRSSSSSSWSNISRTSSTYVSDYSSAWSNGYYKMTSSDDGEVILRNLIEFKKSGYYRIYIEDTDGNEDYVQINVYGSDGTSNNTLEISVSPSSPDTYEGIKVTIETDDDYTDKINFSKFQYRSSNSSSWSNISRTSSTYVSDYSSDWADGYYRMTSSDDGEATLKNLVKFKKTGYYRIYVEDLDGNEDYVQISVSDSNGNDTESSSNSDLSLLTDDSHPYTNKPISITIKTEDDYSGKIKLYAKYKDSLGNRTKITNVSSTYFSDYSSIWENGYYNMKSSDKGKKTLSDLMEFKKEGIYRIYAEDEQGYSNYILMNVTSSSNTKSSNNSAVSNQVNTPETDDIDKLISQLLGNDSGASSDINNDIERNKNNLKDVSDEIYKSRSCKEYRIQYNVDLGVFTSPDLKKKEFFINKEYLKRYIDSKNPQKDGCPVNSGWITTIYRDKSSNNGHYISPNGKIYFISFENGYYFSDDLTVQKKFSTISEIKYYIRDRNPLIGMQ